MAGRAEGRMQCVAKVWAHHLLADLPNLGRLSIGVAPDLTKVNSFYIQKPSVPSCCQRQAFANLLEKERDKPLIFPKGHGKLNLVGPKA